MTLRKLDKSEWKSRFDILSKTLVGNRADLEVASLEIGDHMEAEWMPFAGIVYEPKEDVIEVILEDSSRGNIDHIIHKPREVYIDSGEAFRGLAIVDGDGIMQIVRLRDPLMLSPPA
jgi:hypothetical protein